MIVAVPGTGVVLALGTPPDHLGPTRSIARGPRSYLLGAALVATLTAVIFQPQLSLLRPEEP